MYDHQTFSILLSVHLMRSIGIHSFQKAISVFKEVKKDFVEERKK